MSTYLQHWRPVSWALAVFRSVPQQVGCESRDVAPAAGFASGCPDAVHAPGLRGFGQGRHLVLLRGAGQSERTARLARGGREILLLHTGPRRSSSRLWMPSCDTSASHGSRTQEPPLSGWMDSRPGRRSWPGVRPCAFRSSS
ncbi:hypothetical protein chiPu_0020617 [Chiloscyllium punctatum]|uniref:Uncharacterized protein n=1 Tax=Chiloscyllium punctatum TaxID=137246 RepID=A0A401RHK9_CHIPU|nr:hypothetical protein [Chiloscyllium punctatum]